MHQIIDAIAVGRLAPGEKLASHRDLSEQLVIAPLTVKKAYDELESQRYIETHRGRGTFVCAKLPSHIRGAQTVQLQNAARALLSQAYLNGMTFPEVVELLAEAEKKMLDGPAKRQKHA
jgi:GntR family transcriptional regulator